MTRSMRLSLDYAYRRAAPSLFFLASEGTFTGANELDLAAHAVAVNGAGIDHVQILPLALCLEGQFDRVAGDRAGDVRLAELALEGPSDVVAMLGQDEGRRAVDFAEFDGHPPGARDVGGVRGRRATATNRATRKRTAAFRKMRRPASIESSIA
jgi:hypothetical protein